MRKLLSTTLAATLMIATASVVAAQKKKMGMMDMDMMHECMQGMKMMDADGDGAVSKEEFAQANEEVFAAMDKDGNGKLVSKEQTMIMKGMMRHHKIMEKK